MPRFERGPGAGRNSMSMSNCGYLSSTLKMSLGDEVKLLGLGDAIVRYGSPRVDVPDVLESPPELTSSVVEVVSW